MKILLQEGHEIWIALNKYDTNSLLLQTSCDFMMFNILRTRIKNL